MHNEGVATLLPTDGVQVESIDKKSNSAEPLYFIVFHVNHFHLPRTSI